MTKRTSSYVMTANPDSVSDMMEIELVKKTVRMTNALSMNLYKNAMTRYEYGYEAIKPKKPNMQRVRLMARGPRRTAAIADGKRKYAYDQSLPLRHAKTLDVYIHTRY